VKAGIVEIKRKMKGNKPCRVCDGVGAHTVLLLLGYVSQNTALFGLDDIPCSYCEGTGEDHAVKP